MANTHLSRGRTSRGMPVLMESFALVEELGDERLSVLPRFARAYFMLDSEPRMAIEELTQVIELANKYGDRDLEATALGIKAMIAARLGEFQQAEQAADSALQLVAELNSPMTETDVDLFAGFSYLDMGDADRGLEYGQRAVDKALSTDRIECICNGFVCVGFGLLQHQQLPEAIEAFEESIRRSTASGATQIEYMGRTGLAVAELMSGRTGAVQEMETTLDSAKSLGDPYIIAFLSQWLGEGHAQLDGSNEGAQRAEGYLEAALDYYRRAGMNPYAVRALHSLASIYGRQGRDEDASRALAEAEELSKGLQFPEESGIAGT